MDLVDASAIPEPLPAEWLDNPEAPGYFRKLSDAILGKSGEKCPWRTNYVDAYETKDGKWKVNPSIMYARHCYFADIVHLDAQLDRVKKALEENGRLENTYIIFTADHGELLADKGFIQKGARHYDACIRVPLIVAGPGLRKGEKREEFVQLEDICPTVLDMTQTSLPVLPVMAGLKNEKLKDLAGSSLLPLCKEEAPREWRQEAYVESYNQTGVHHPGSWARTIRNKKYRYTFYPEGNGEQLFDLEKDKNEEINLADKPVYQGIKNDLMRQLMELIILQDYPMPRRDLFSFGVH